MVQLINQKGVVFVKKSFFLGFSLFVLLSVFTFTNGSTPNCTEWIVADVNGSYVAGSNINSVWPLASITKLMTAYVTLENIQEGKISLSTVTTVNRVAANTSGSSAELPRGQEIMVDDLLKGMIIPSGNDAAVALAYLEGNGNVANFVAQMNAAANSLGMKNTHFYTPDGLPSSMTGKPLDVSTAADLAILASKLEQSKTFMSICSLGTAKICNGSIKLYSTNPILISVPGTTGMKTGHHNEAKYNIVVTTNRGGKKYIIVVLGGKTEQMRDDLAKQYINLAYSSVVSYPVFKENGVVKTLPVKWSDVKTLNLIASQTVILNIIKGTQNKITYTYSLPKALDSNINKNQVMGTVSIFYQGTYIETLNLLAQNSIKKNSIITDVKDLI